MPAVRARGEATNVDAITKKLTEPQSARAGKQRWSACAQPDGEAAARTRKHPEIIDPAKSTLFRANCRGSNYRDAYERSAGQRTGKRILLKPRSAMRWPDIPNYAASSTTSTRFVNGMPFSSSFCANKPKN